MALAVVAYDISHDRRRARVHTLLLAWGDPVRRSVFECDLDDSQLARLRRALRKRLRPSDNVRIYHLCADCAERVDTDLGAPRVSPSAVHIA